MKVLLIKPPSPIPGFFAPLGLGYLGAVLERAGHHARIVDLGAEGSSNRQLGHLLHQERPDLVGITGMITEYHAMVQTAQLCKEFLPEVPVIVGGALPTSMPNLFLDKESIDFVAIGEGEATILEVVERLESGRDMEGVPGVAYRGKESSRFNPPRPPNLDLDSLPLPAYHLMALERYIASHDNWFGGGAAVRATNIISSRGCPYSCIYCDKSVAGSKWRGRGAASIAAEMSFLNSNYGINGFLFSDDMFDINRKRVHQICDEIEQQGLKVLWGVNSRVNHASEEMYRRMHQAGCRYVTFGIESGNQDVLDFMGKGITLEQIREAIRTARGAGLRAIGVFMIGMLGEDQNSINRTIQFAKSLDLDSGGFSKVVPLPNTRLYDLARAVDKAPDDDSFFRAQEFGGDLNLSQDLSTKELGRLLEKAYWNFFWSRPSRRLPRFLCRLMSALFPMVYWFSGGRMEFIVHFNRLRERLHLPLP